MSDDLLQVELVAADRRVWSGQAKMVIARTTEGDIGILPNHAPVLSLMVDGFVEVTTAENEKWIAEVDAGFLSIANNAISILSEHAEISQETDLESARAGLVRTKTAEGDDEAEKAARQAEARIRAAEKAS